MDPERRGVLPVARIVMEPWDGPAALIFTDGVAVGAALDRNGLRPLRYWATDDRARGVRVGGRRRRPAAGRSVAGSSVRAR